MNIQGEEMVMFGDNDIADGACKQLGITFVLVTGYQNKTWFREQGDAQKPDSMMEKITQNAMEDLIHENV